MDTRFGNCHGLLFHDFVDRDAVLVRHFVEFVDADNPAVREDHGAGLEVAVAGVAVFRDGGGEADAGRAAAGGGDGERGGFEDEAEDLRLGGGRVADHEDVDVAAEVGAGGEVLLLAAKQLQQHRLLDHFVPADRRRDGARQAVHDVLLGGKLLDVAHVFFRQVEPTEVAVLGQLPHHIRNHDRLKNRRRLRGSNSTQGPERPHHPHPIPRLAHVHQIAVHRDLHGPR
mmetsp:Transcript_9429/g.23667  ORF Transcript_9429/g.23667 Transcript_9429/m.23667 type:complete len:228 (-) Transcript_9429:477-1160(-)